MKLPECRLQGSADLFDKEPDEEYFRLSEAIRSLLQLLCRRSVKGATHEMSAFQ